MLTLAAFVLAAGSVLFAVPCIDCQGCEPDTKALTIRFRAGSAIRVPATGSFDYSIQCSVCKTMVLEEDKMTLGRVTMWSHWMGDHRRFLEQHGAR